LNTDLVTALLSIAPSAAILIGALVRLGGLQKQLEHLASALEKMETHLSAENDKTETRLLRLERDVAYLQAQADHTPAPVTVDELRERSRRHRLRDDDK
jgi:hypothetical protein